MITSHELLVFPSEPVYLMLLSINSIILILFGVNIFAIVIHSKSNSHKRVGQIAVNRTLFTPMSPRRISVQLFTCLKLTPDPHLLSNCAKLLYYATFNCSKYWCHHIPFSSVVIYRNNINVSFCSN